VWAEIAPHLHDSINAVTSAGNDVSDSVKKPFGLGRLSSWPDHSFSKELCTLG
jgi:hypothetical protein